MKVQITGFITYRQPRAWDGPDAHGFTFLFYNPEEIGGDDRVVVQPHTFEVEVPDNFDPRPQMVKALEAEKEKARKDFAATVARIDRQINELLALEHTT